MFDEILNPKYYYEIDGIKYTVLKDTLWETYDKVKWFISMV